MSVHPSKQQRQRAEFIAEDLVDAVEAYLAATCKQWIDGGPATEARRDMAEYVHYVRTGEAVSK